LCLFEAQKKLKVLQSINIEVPSDLQSLDEVLFDFNQIYQDFIPLRDWLECRLALAEGFTNAVRHAHKNLSSDISIKIEVHLGQEAMEIRIWDYGSVFDLQSFIAETSQKNSNWLGSGRGIPILNKISDRLDYYRTEQQQNCLFILKEFENRQSHNPASSQDTI
jgi:serine/threonine-protein kinase RsbW